MGKFKWPAGRGRLYLPGVLALVAVVAAVIVAGIQTSPKLYTADVTGSTTACRYDVGIAGPSTITAPSVGTFDVSAYPVNCTTEGDTAISLTVTSTPSIFAGLTMPTCIADTTLHLPISGVAKAKINCTTTTTTATGFYKYTANFSSVNGVTPTSTWFSFNVANSSEVCTGLNLSLDKSTYNTGDPIQLTYSCVNGKQIAAVKLQVCYPNATCDEKSDIITTLNNVSSGAYTIPSTNFTTAGSYLVRTCIYGTQPTATELGSKSCGTGGSTNSTPVNITTTTSTTTTGSTCTKLTLSADKTSYNKGDTVNYTYACSPVGTRAANTTVQVVKPDGTATTYNSGTNIDTASLGFSTSNLTAGSYVLRACLDATCTSNVTAVTFTIVDNPATNPPSACAVGAKCPSNSWCQNGQQFYYPTGELTCVAWLNDGTEPQAPAGTSECRPTDTNCVPVEQTVDYVSGKWCSRGMSYYSKDGKKMTCVRMGGTPPSDYSSCRPDDKQCIPGNSYGPSTGWCTNAMKFYQKVKDADPNNDIYCAEWKMPAPGTAMTTPPPQPTPPAGYGSCDPTGSNTGCKEIGDKWTDTNTSNWCSNGQKCTSATGGGSCVGWNESCPAGSKYCSSSDTSCVEPGEYKTITNTTTGGNSYWCGGGGGMTFYSATQAYCEPKKTITSGTSGTSMMWTGAEIKTILSKLGAGWGICPKTVSTTSGGSQCIEPGQSGPSSGWCAWWPPMATGGYMNPNPDPNSKRTCPSLDDTGTGTVPTPTPVIGPPKVEPPMPPTKEICPKSMEAVISCLPGSVIVKETTPNGCVIASCRPEKEGPQPPMPPPVGTTPPPFPVGQDFCRSVREETRNYKYEIRNIQQQIKFLPKGTAAPETVAKGIAQVQELTGSIDKLLNGAKCTPELSKSAQGKVETLRNTMNDLRNESQQLAFYARRAQFIKDLGDRVTSLKKDARHIGDRVDFSEEISKLNEIIAKAKDADEFTMQDLEFDRSDVEQAITDKYNNIASEGRDSFIGNTISSIRNGLAEARAKVVAKGLESDQCTKTLAFFDQIDGMLTDAEQSYKNGDQENAGALLDKVSRFKGPVTEAAKQCGVSLNIDEHQDVGAVFSGVQNFDQIKETLINEIVDRAASKFQAVLEEKFKETIANMTKLTDDLQKKIEQSVATLQSMPKIAARETVVESKNKILDATSDIQAIQGRLPSTVRGRLSAVLERVARNNWCGTYAESMPTRIEALKTHAENNDLTVEDVTTVETATADAEKANAEECYQTKLSRFRDTDPASWYFGYIQSGSFFKGNADGYVEPGRQTQRQEALIAVERTLGMAADGTCQVTNTGIRNSEWANCAVNTAIGNGLALPSDMIAPVSRDEVASWIVALAKNKLPVNGTASYGSGFRDIRSCAANTAAVDTVLANKIMTGYTGERAGSWGCGEQLVRAELAAILNRLSDITSLTAGTATTVPVPEPPIEQTIR